MCVLLIKRLLRLVGRWARKPVNHTSWVAVVTPTDRPKSVRNRCLIELFCGVVCVVTLPFWHFRWCRGFCHRTESDLFLFLIENNMILLWHFFNLLCPSIINQQRICYYVHVSTDVCFSLGGGIRGTHCTGNRGTVPRLCHAWPAQNVLRNRQVPIYIHTDIVLQKCTRKYASPYQHSFWYCSVSYSLFCWRLKFYVYR